MNKIEGQLKRSNIWKIYISKEVNKSKGTGKSSKGVNQGNILKIKENLINVQKGCTTVLRKLTRNINTKTSCRKITILKRPMKYFGRSY